MRIESRANRMSRFQSAHNKRIEREQIVSETREQIYQEIMALEVNEVLSMGKYILTTYGERHWMSRYKSEVLQAIRGK